MKTYRIIFPDFNGALRGKLVSEEHFKNAKDFGMPRSVLTADIEGDEVKSLPEFHIKTGDEDMRLVPDSSTLLPVPYEDYMDQVIVDLIDMDGQPIQVAPRKLLQTVLSEYRKLGFEVKVSSELEFYLLNSDGSLLSPKELEVPYADINSLDRLHAFIQDVLELTRKLGLTPEMVLKESGVGQLEITYSANEALFMADRTLYYKQLVKEYARRHGLMASFMAKPFKDESGSGGHVHVSLWKDGKNALTDANLLDSFVAGQLRYLKSLTSIFAPNTNSYKRLGYGGYVATKVSYAEEDRNVVVRIIGKGENRHIEHRLAGADKNAYLIFYAILKAGLQGIQNHWKTTDKLIKEELGTEIPSDLESALKILPQAGEILGADFVRIYSAIKQQELTKIKDNGEDWELTAYGPQV